ncbi:MAG: PstS family phosphate ABC transporter substrate-binding protein [Oscillospiraceae bacterium]
MKKCRLKKADAVIICLCAMIVIVFLYMLIRAETADRSALEREPDKTANVNVNVMLKRNEDWKQIASQKLVGPRAMAMIDGSTATIPITAELARQFIGASDETVELYFSHNTTHNAYVNLIDGAVNKTIANSSGEQVSIIFVTQPSDEELEYAEQKGIELDVSPIALDGFVFITHKDNPVESLTVEQICDIYSGKITNWKEVGGKDEKIVAYQREKNSGSQTAMENIVMKGKPLAECPHALRPEGMGELIECVAEYENNSCSIGYTYYYYMNNLYKNPDIKIININGVSPKNENLISGEYPFKTAYYAVIRKSEQDNSKARELRDYLLSEEGQRIVEMAGYCPAGE